MKILSTAKMLCLCCMEEHAVQTVTVREHSIFKSVPVEYTAEYFYCDQADETYADEQQISSNDIAMKNAYREKMGLLTSGQIAAISDGKTILYNGHDSGKIPVSNGLSDKVSRELKKRGFKFVGGVTIYSHLQACGIINDHESGCRCYQRIVAEFPTVRKRRFGEKLK